MQEALHAVTGSSFGWVRLGLAWWTWMSHGAKLDRSGHAASALQCDVLTCAGAVA